VAVMTSLLSLMIANQSWYIFSFSPLAIILTFAFSLGFMLLIYALSNIIISVFITINLFSSIAVASMIKYELRNMPAVFDDFLLFDEVGRMESFFSLTDYLGVIVSIIIFNVICILGFLLVNKNFDLKSSKSLRFMGIFLGTILIAGSMFGIENNPQSYDKSGAIYVYVDSILDPARYSLDEIEKDILATLIDEKGPDISDSIHSQLQPNIIIIMNESFWDLDQLPGVTLSPNPYEIFNSLKEESLFGRLEIPVFAGGTSNTEFELLSSVSTHMYEEGLMVFNNEIQGPIISLASILRNQGYHSTGLHPFWGWFYHRNQLYSHFGFDEFITSEHINGSSLKGYYISDDTTTDVIIDQLEKQEDPLFLYAVTMQNHGPYDDGRFDNIDLDITVSGENLDEIDQELLEVYGQSIHDAVNSLDKLIDYLKDSEEPSVVLFFGDHLPMLGADFKVYKDTGYLVESDDYVTKHLLMRTTPFLLWSNTSDESQDLGIIDTTFIGPYLLDRLYLDMPDYYRYQLEVHESISLINPVFLMLDDSPYFAESDYYQSISTPMVAVQKDVLYGERTFESNPEKYLIEDNFSYNQSLEHIVFDSVSISDSGLVIQGQNLYEKAHLTLNGETVPFITDGATLTVSKEHLPDDNLIKIKMQLIDTVDKTIAKSDEYTYRKQP
jgi:hypothetical protein